MTKQQTYQHAFKAFWDAYSVGAGDLVLDALREQYRLAANAA